ncbi:hypothetical protein ACIA78_39205, partial [Streptomyces xanthochromogenes]
APERRLDLIKSRHERILWTLSTGLTIYRSFSDFGRSVHGIVAQPFLLQTVLEGKIRNHIPDHLLLTDQVPVVVDVKPLHRETRHHAT